jgi:hypothetical protein
MGDVVAIELAIQGSSPDGNARRRNPANGSEGQHSVRGFLLHEERQIERFDCYPALNIMLKQMGVLPDFDSAVRRSTPTASPLVPAVRRA